MTKEGKVPPIPQALIQGPREYLDTEIYDFSYCNVLTNMKEIP